MFGSVKDAVRDVQPDASVIYVPPAGAADAIIEAIENEIPLIVTITEGILSETRSGCTTPSEPEQEPYDWRQLPRIISETCKMGIMPGHIFSKGKIGQSVPHRVRFLS